MIPHSIVIDDFLPDFAGWRNWADTLDYAGETNPVDGVTYPGIYSKVPTWGTKQRLDMIMGAPVAINMSFLRLSLQGTPVPHWAHNDASMGQYSLMVYMNRPEHCDGGTALVRHLQSESVEIAQADSNDPTKWQIYGACEMKANRAFIFRSDLMHAAMPVGGFGDNAQNGRLVLTAFFNL